MVFAVVGISFALVFIVIHIFVRAYIENQATQTLYAHAEYTEQYTSQDYENDEEAWQAFEQIEKDSPFQVTYIDVTEDYILKSDDMSAYTAGRHIIAWCRSHAGQTGEVMYVETPDNMYYVEQIPYWYTYEGTEESGILILSVNIGGVLWMFSVAEVIMAIIMFFCTCIASWFGYKTGKSIEEEQETQKRFFENASHELKTPLMSIQGFAEGLQGGIIEEPEHAYRVIMKETSRMADLVDEILLLSKYDRKQQTLMKEKISVAELVGDCLDMLGAEIRKRDLLLTVDIADQFIEVDEEQMRRAVSNILSNALRYAKTKISVTYRENRLCIWDDGEPPAEDELATIFERFHTGKNGNTGIGLALAKEVVEAHGYSICAENRDGGVQFVILTRPQ